VITGVVLMTYGSPRDLDDVGAYITRVRGGREPDATLLAEFRRRYDVIDLDHSRPGRRPAVRPRPTVPRRRRDALL
jgi:hypothetical protein